MHQSEPRFSHLVVVGASAGGIESLSVLVSTLPRAFSAPIVIAQHLSPDRDSALADILARRGPLPVRTIESRATLEPGVIYVVPPNRNVAVTDHEVLLHSDGQAPLPSIDLLFTSAAEVFGENLIAVVLSGTGSDGAAGAREVKYAGGTVVIQNPETAAYPGMPLSLAPSVVDIISNRDRIGELLNELVTGRFVIPPATERSQLRTFLDELREESGVDFTTYKQPTIERRLQRRLVATGQSTFADYVRYVHQHPEERQRLINSFLIKVTEFFRDPELFRYLREQVLPELLREARARNSDIRIWSAGCATGEEAYSLAMTVLDALDSEGANVNVRIFATDLDGEAVAFARRGIYPARALAQVPPETLQRHFVEHEDGYEVKKSLRSILVFGEHDLGQRAPFPRIDLILCRNVLIYFTAALQRRALQLFAFSLRTGGYLVLGKSETVSPLAEYFAVDQPRLKAYRRIGERALIPPSRMHEAMPLTTVGPPTKVAMHSVLPRPPRVIREGGRGRSLVHGEHILLGLPFGVIVVDQRYDIHYINGEARRAFGIHSAALDQDLIHLLQYFDPLAVRRAIDEARDSGRSARHLLTSQDEPPGAQRTLEVVCNAIIAGDDDSERLVTVTTADVTQREQLAKLLDSNEAQLVRLQRVNDEVLAANQELTQTITRLRAENEELQVASEEIQAATEEVETLNEELQASNEELETLNEELQSTVEELNTTNDDLQARTIELQAVAIEGETSRSELWAILDGVVDAVVVVDAQGEIVLRNDAYTARFDVEDGTLLNADGVPFDPGASPIERAARGEALAMPFALDVDGTRMWYVAHSRPVASDSRGPLAVVTIRETEAPG